MKTKNMSLYNTTAKFLISIGLIGCVSKAADINEFNMVANTTIADSTQLIKMITLLDNPYYISADGKELYLYVRVKSGKAPENINRTPLNVSLVLDRSGSMGSDRKLENAKEAVKFVIDNLGSEDKFSLVIYDTDVEILSPSSPVTNKELLKKKVAEIFDRSATNLSGGMLEGYAQVKSTYLSKNVNRVLLLSDGLANEGITDPLKLHQIVKQRSTEDGISISTFGVGADFNEDLMTDLAEYGNGNYYFINSSDKIPEIFAKELKGLLSVVAQNSKLRIKYPGYNLKLNKVYGYPYSEENGEVIVDFKDIFSEEEKAVLLKFDITGPVKHLLEFESRLTYDNAVTYKREDLRQYVQLIPVSDTSKFSSGKSEEVSQNIVLFESNELMQKAIKAADERKFTEADSLAKMDIQYMEKSFKKIKADSALIKQYNNLKKYQKDMTNANTMSDYEFKSLQKSNKSSNYMIKKKK
jgi:Ca-activated chloride channel family protein